MQVGGDTDGDSSTYGPPSRDPLYAGIKDVARKGDGDVNGEQALTATNQGSCPKVQQYFVILFLKFVNIKYVFVMIIFLYALNIIA